MAEEVKEGLFARLLRSLPGAEMGKRNEKAADAVKLPPMDYYKKYGVMPEKDPDLSR